MRRPRRVATPERRPERRSEFRAQCPGCQSSPSVLSRPIASLAVYLGPASTLRSSTRYSTSTNVSRRRGMDLSVRPSAKCDGPKPGSTDVRNIHVAPSRSRVRQP